MKFTARLRSACGLFVMFCLLATSVVAMGSKGKKNYEQGLRYEAAQQWEKAAEEFILAVAADPSNIQYQLHYRRAIFNASQEAMKKGDALAQQKDFLGAYNAFRQAYGYDSTNVLAVSESERMLRLKREKDTGAIDADAEPSSAQARFTPTSTQVGFDPSQPRGRQQQSSAPTRVEQLRVVTYKGDLKNFIRSLADELHLDVLFDSQSFQKPRTIEVKLHDVTTAKALDFLFMQEGLFFQKLDRNTIFVADQSKRPQYQELVIQTFYLANIDPEEARTMIQAAIPAQAGRPASNVIPHKSTNSITVRDTAENIRLISNLLENVDKDLAEVVMEVNIYEMQHNDLLQLGNQVGTANSLGNLFSTGGLVAPVGSGALQAAGQALTNLPTALGAAFLIPSSTFSAFQQKDRSRLLASTQIHAFDREASRARIGQRVPIQTAQITSLGFNNGSNTTPAGGTSGVFGGTGYPVINYEPVGLTLDFTPQVFPNLDVQVKMNIESKDVQGLGSLTPTFTERSISGTARIKNNQTMMIASVAQTNQARGRQGLPILGLVPVLGRLFSTPTHNNYQTDIIITVTPHVLRAPSVTPRDLRGFPSGSQQMPIAGSLEAMLRETDRAEQPTVASRPAENQPAISSPSAGITALNALPGSDQSPAYIPAPKALLPSAAVNAAAEAPDTNTSGAAKPITISTSATASPEILPASQELFKNSPPQPALLQSPIVPASVVKDVNTQPASLEPSKEETVKEETVKEETVSASAVGGGELRFEHESQELSVGEKRRLTIFLNADSPLSLVVLPLRFDPRVISVRAVSAGYSLANIQTAPTITQTLSPGGKLLISLSLPPEATTSGHPGIVIQLDLEALEAGESMIGVEPGSIHLIAPEGHDLNMRAMPTRVSVKR